MTKNISTKHSFMIKNTNGVGDGKEGHTDNTKYKFC